MNIAIAPATLCDVPDVAKIERAVFTDPWTERSFESLVHEPRAYFACARWADAVDSANIVLGYVVTLFAVDEGEIANLAVADNVRGLHVGSALLDAAIHEAVSRRVGELYLEVRESNVSARRLYGSRTFEEVGRRPGYYRRPSEDALILRRQLALPFT